MTCDPAKRTTSILNRRRRRRLVPGSILNIDRRPAHRQVRQQKQNVAFLLTVNPTTAMKENQRRRRIRPVFGEIKIEFQFEVVSLCISDIRKNVVLSRNVIDPGLGTGLRKSRTSHPQITQNK